MSDYDLKEYLPTVMKQDFWQDFMDVVSTEVNTLLDLIREKKTFFDIDSLDEKDRLIEISKTLGYTPDLSLDDTLVSLKEDVRSITFRIENKTNYVSYQYIFKTVPYSGELFILYFTEDKLVRAYDSVANIVSNLETHAYDSPFVFEAEENYSQFLFEQLFLDSGLFLDSINNPWFLDTLTSTLKTNHIAAEYSIERIITLEGTEYLMTPVYLDYLFNAVDYTRKVTEVPHVGSHLSLIMDETGFYDSYSSGTDSYSIPTLKTKCAVTDQYVDTDPALNAKKLVVGTGTQNLPSVDDAVPSWPTALSNQFAYDVLVDDQKQETTDWKIFLGRLQANTVIGESLGTGTGHVFEYDDVLNYTDLKRFSFEATFTATPNNYKILDNGQEELYLETYGDDYPIGSINYTTGAVQFTTEQEIKVDREEITNLSVTEILNYFTSFTPIEPGTCILHYQIGQTTFTKTDDGFGNFPTGSGLDGGTINYITGEINLDFSSATEAGETVWIEYQYTVDLLVDNGSKIIVDYEVEEDLEITEAGVIDENDNLIAYATFPPIKMDDVKYHASFQFIVKKGTFGS